MSSSKKCPVCKEPYKSRIKLGTIQRLEVLDESEICVSSLYDRIMIHKSE